MNGIGEIVMPVKRWWRLIHKTVKMHGMAQAASDLMEQGSPAFEAAIPILSQLLKAETAEREVRSIAYQIKAARFPVYKDLTGFDFASSEVNEALVRQLHRWSSCSRPKTSSWSADREPASLTLLRL